MGILNAVITRFVSAGPLLILFTWTMTFFGSFIAFWVQVPAGDRSLRGYLRFCFPPEVFRHRSCRLDLLYMLSLKLVHPFVVVPFVIGNIALAVAVHAGLTQLLGERPAGEMSGLAWVAILVLLILVEDFMTFFAHYLMHIHASLWELHKTHHSAEYMVPLTNRRFHPLQTVFDKICTSTAVGVASGIIAYAFALPLAEFFVAKVDAYYIVNALSFHHLRHSHVRLSYGWLERYLLSPAQHQLHHSCLLKHWDKNFGLLLSCWDRLFGTIAYTRPGDVYKLGLPPDSGEFSTVAQLYLTPLKRIAQSVAHRLDRHRAARGGTGSDLVPAAAPPSPGFSGEGSPLAVSVVSAPPSKMAHS